MEESSDEDIVIRLNSPGGEVYSAYGVIAKFLEHSNGKVIKADGRADSGAAFLLCYSPYNECLDVSTFLFHRAAYPSYIESDPSEMNNGLLESLKKINKDLRAAMEGKFTAKLWKEVTGVSLDDLFSLEQRIDVQINAQQAKKLGLINKINKITPEKKAQIDAMAFQIAARAEVDAQDTQTVQSKINNKMTLQEFKAQHPDVYAQAFKEGQDDERDRVSAFMAYAHIDLDGVKAEIEAGNKMNQKFMAEYSLKAISATQKAAITADTAQVVVTGSDPGTQVNQAAEAFEASVRKKLNLSAA